MLRLHMSVTVIEIEVLELCWEGHDFGFVTYRKLNMGVLSTVSVLGTLRSTLHRWVTQPKPRTLSEGFTGMGVQN